MTTIPPTTPALQRFLSSTDLDESQDAASGIDPAVASMVLNSVIEEWTDRQAVANILFHPYLLPGDAQLGALSRGMGGEDSYLQLAAAVGVGSLSGTDRMGDAAHDQLVSGLIQLIKTGHNLIARRAAVSLSVVLWPEDALDTIALLAHPDGNVRTAVLAGFVSVFEPMGIRTLLQDKSFVPEALSSNISAQLAQDGIDLQEDDLNVAPPLDYIPNLEQWTASP